jgi:hypothetical protein
MTPGIADTLNRQTAQRLSTKADEIDAHLGFQNTPWYWSPIAATLMGESSDRAWLVSALMCEHVEAADEDWENLFANIRAEIEARRTRDPRTPSVRAAETPVPDGVGSR